MKHHTIIQLHRVSHLKHPHQVTHTFLNTLFKIGVSIRPNTSVWQNLVRVVQYSGCRVGKVHIHKNNLM